jgi:hypothetical protein
MLNSLLADVHQGERNRRYVPRVCKNSEGCRSLCGIWLNETVLLNCEFELGIWMTGQPTALSLRVLRHRALRGEKHSDKKRVERP